MSKYITILFAVLVAMLLTACGSGQDWLNSDNPLQELECDVANKTDGVCSSAPAAPAVSEQVPTANMHTDKAYDAKNSAFGMTCVQELTQNVQAANGDWAAVCTSTVDACHDVNGTFTVDKQGYGRCSSVVVKLAK